MIHLFSIKDTVLISDGVDSSVYKCTNFAAFHILLPNFFADTVHSSSNGTSCPGLAFSISENLKASAPCFSDNSKGSIVFPRLFDIFLPCESLTKPWIRISLNGIFSIVYKPIMIILATQKKIISKPVTSKVVG